MSGFLPRWYRHPMWTVFICLLLFGDVLAETSCEWGTTYLQADGTRRLLAFPSDRSVMYPDDCSRRWRITSNGGWVQLYFLSFDIEGSVDTGCIYDYLEIYTDVSYGVGRRIGKLCGTLANDNRNFNTNSSSVLLRFFSDSSVQRRGFEVYYFNGRENNEQDVVRQITATPGTQFLTYPEGDFNYPNGADVRWRIMSSSSYKKLKIFLVSLDTEHSSNCEYDSLVIYNGFDSSAPILRRFCGGLDLLYRTFTSSSRYLFLHFTSDTSTTGKGFELRYADAPEETVCNSDQNNVINLIASDIDTDLSSPNYPASYPSGCLVQWRILSERYLVQFTIVAMDLEAVVNCEFDFVAFYDGYDDSARLLKRLCGNPDGGSNTFVSSSDYVFVRFYSDSSGGGQGFQLYYKAEDLSEVPGTGGNSGSSTGNSAVIVGVIFGAVCLVLLITGLVLAIVRRTRNEHQRQRRLQQMATNSSLVNTSTGSQPPGVYVINPSAPPPPYEMLNHAYVHEEPPPSYSEANLYATYANAPPLYSTAVLNNFTAGQSNPAMVTTAAFKEQADHTYINGVALGTNTDNQGTSLSHIPNTGQEPFAESVQEPQSGQDPQSVQEPQSVQDPRSVQDPQSGLEPQPGQDPQSLQEPQPDYEHYSPYSLATLGQEHNEES